MYKQKTVGKAGKDGSRQSQSAKTQIKFGKREPKKGNHTVQSSGK